MSPLEPRAEISADPEVPLVRITREFAAPAGRVFRAHAEPELVAQWLGPRRYRTEMDHYDCRTGGSYRYLHVGQEGRHEFFGGFHEVRPDQLIVQTFAYQGAPDDVALQWLEFVDEGAGRSRLVSRALVASFAARDAFLAGGMEAGMQESYWRLDELLEAQS
ncbi:MAG: SRPBCC family protein [Candidatus Dormibacteria bacterium]